MGIHGAGRCGMGLIWMEWAKTKWDRAEYNDMEWYGVACMVWHDDNVLNHCCVCFHNSDCLADIWPFWWANSITNLLKASCCVMCWFQSIWTLAWNMEMVLMMFHVASYNKTRPMMRVNIILHDIAIAIVIIIVLIIVIANVLITFQGKWRSKHGRGQPPRGQWRFSLPLLTIDFQTKKKHTSFQKRKREIKKEP